MQNLQAVTRTARITPSAAYLPQRRVAISAALRPACGRAAQHIHSVRLQNATLSRASTLAFSRNACSPARKQVLTCTMAQEGAAPRYMGKQRICVLGGGFGGLYTALRLNSLPWQGGSKPEVVLVDQNDKFVFKPLLYELLNGGVTPAEVAPTFKELLAPTNVTFRQASVESIEPPEDSDSPGSVRLADGETLEYDWLVLALGAQPRVGKIPGVMEHAFPFSTLEDAQRVDARLYELEADIKSAPIRVAVVGGGPSGVELAATVAERLGERGEVQLLTSGADILAVNPSGQREDAKKVLDAQRINVLTGCRVVQVHGMNDKVDQEEVSTEHIVELDDGRMVPADLVLWTAGQAPVVPQVSEAVGAYGLPLANAGEALTDAFLRVRSQQRMFALGDAAFITDSQGTKLPATAQVAFQAADYAGWNVWASINGRPLLPFKYQHLGDMMALGVMDASVAFPFDFTLAGRPASLLRKAAYVYRQPTLDQAVKVGMGMVTRPIFDIVTALGGKPQKK